MYEFNQDIQRLDPNDIVRFFSVKERTIQDLINTNPEFEAKLDLGDLCNCCNKLEAAGVLLKVTGYNLFETSYVTSKNYNEINFDYGVFDYIVGGFEKIINVFKSSVLPVIVQNKNGEYNIGSSFLIGNQYTLITAKHVIENMKSIQVLDSHGNPIPIFKIYVSSDSNVDLAVILIEHHAQDIKAFRLASSNLLMEILSIGYPPIPGFESIQVFDRSHINSFLRLSKGNIVSISNSYLDGQDFILFNAKVKGGNSGGPIINNEGYVVGMLVQIPIADNDANKLDSLGYGIAITHDSINSILKDDGRTDLKITYNNKQRTDVSTLDY